MTAAAGALDARTLLAGLRAGQAPDAAALAAFAQGLADGSVTDAQAGAFAMAVCTRGLGEAGRVALTRAMRDSGDCLSWDLPGPVVDKHSTGGVGDSVSLLLAPALAACGVFVPMISGRGLGHTGGTLDKLESIPGYTVDLGEDRLRAVVADVGCAICGATGRIAPADKRLYAIRDVTGTVESIDLITSSILAKKLAAGLQALVLDVKVGSGAFMAAPEDARALAEALATTATGAGCPTVALITDMDQPLMRSAGNALELAEVLGVLTGTGSSPQIRALAEALGGALLTQAGVATDDADGTARIARALDSGAAAERFARMVAAQGGPADLLDRPALPAAPVIRDIPAPGAGTVAAIDARAVGEAVVALGGGRRRDGDAIDPSVGFSALARVGETVGPDRPLGQVHAADAETAEAAAAALAAAFRLGDPPLAPPLVHARVG